MSIAELFRNPSWEAISSLPPTELLAFGVIAWLALMVVGAVCVGAFMGLYLLWDEFRSMPTSRTNDDSRS